MTTDHVDPRAVLWPTLVKNITDRIEAVRTSLENAPPESIAALQGQVRALRWVLDTPNRYAIDRAKEAEGDGSSGGY